MNTLPRLCAVASARCLVTRRGRLPAIVAALLLLTQPAAAELINGSNFEAGMAGFTTDYAHSPTFLDGPGLVAVVHNPALVFDKFVNFGDHTTGSGLMLAVNGSTTPNQAVWSQTVAVTPNTDYRFSAWTASLFPISPAHLDFLINDVSIGTATLSSTVGIWEQFTGSWNSGSATSATIQIINHNTVFYGNDFALDDIELTASLGPTEEAPEPSALVLFGLGATVSLAGYLRRRKAAE